MQRCWQTWKRCWQTWFIHCHNEAFNIFERSWQLRKVPSGWKKNKSCPSTQKEITIQGRSWKTQTDQCYDVYGTNNPRSHFQAHKRLDSGWEEPAWLCKREMSPGQPYYFVWCSTGSMDKRRTVNVLRLFERSSI